MRTWVSPRWNRPVPWAVGMTPTSARHGAQVATATAVHADALVDDPLADDLLGERPNGALDLAAPAGEGFALGGELGR